MTIQDRILELRRVPAAELIPNPRNWRTHPQRQREALRGILHEIGFAGALLARQLADGQLELIDGHLRASETPDQLVPVLVLDVTEHEADLLLASFDPLSSMAGSDPAKLQALVDRTNPSDPAVRTMLTRLDETAATAQARTDAEEIDIPPAYQVLIECRDEAEQREVYDQLSGFGLDCRLLLL